MVNNPHRVHLWSLIDMTWTILFGPCFNLENQRQTKIWQVDKFCLIYLTIICCNYMLNLSRLGLDSFYLTSWNKNIVLKEMVLNKQNRLVDLGTSKMKIQHLSLTRKCVIAHWLSTHVYFSHSFLNLKYSIFILFTTKLDKYGNTEVQWLKKYINNKVIHRDYLINWR